MHYGYQLLYHRAYAELLGGVKRVVVKIGSRLIADDPHAATAALAAEVAAQRQRGVEVLVVTSGAIALGMQRLCWSERPRELPRLQAAAAVGQGHLMNLYDQALRGHGLVSAQVLLTHDDVRDRGRYLAAQRALEEGLALGALITDEASAMERAGFTVKMVEGRADNIKVTRSEDLPLAEFHLQRQVAQFAREASA